MINDTPEPEDFDIEDFDENEDPFPVEYDLEEVFDDKIYPMLKTIVNICTEYNIPMLAAFQYKNDEPGQVMLCTSMVLPPKRACEKIHKAAEYLVKSN